MSSLSAIAELILIVVHLIFVFAAGALKKVQIDFAVPDKQQPTFQGFESIDRLGLIQDTEINPDSRHGLCHHVGYPTVKPQIRLTVQIKRQIQIGPYCYDAVNGTAHQAGKGDERKPFPKDRSECIRIKGNWPDVPG